MQDTASGKKGLVPLNSRISTEIYCILSLTTAIIGINYFSTSEVDCRACFAERSDKFLLDYAV